MDKAPNPAINWHTAAFVRHERHYYIFSDCFDPSLYPSPNLDKPRIRDQDGLIQIYHLLSVLGLKKTESYPPVKAASKQSVKGRGLRIDGIWITGLGSTLLQCQRTATVFTTQLMTGEIKLQNNGQPATAPYNGWRLGCNNIFELEALISHKLDLPPEFFTQLPMGDRQN